MEAWSLCETFFENGAYMQVEIVINVSRATSLLPDNIILAL